MMTFLPLEDFLQSALSLDDKRLQNQRTEARFVLEWLEGRGFELEAPGCVHLALLDLASHQLLHPLLRPRQKLHLHGGAGGVRGRTCC